ncbi:hypothetical protein GF377_10165 [candidate division GN15 bacterium]|nr:hypothetical protein [candidate division GN15 bacterium]
MTLRYRIPVLVCAALLFVLGAVHHTSAGDAPGQFDKEPGAYYMGGTAGLTGLDSARGYVDSVYYSRWWEAGIQPAPPVYDPTKVIYGDDNRIEPYTVTDPNLLRLVQATCVVVSLSEISDNGDGTYTLDTDPWLNQSGLPLCADEPFRGQPQIGNCSGFLVGDDIIVTAGHCLSSSSCGSWAFLFDFKMVDSATEPGVIVSEDDIYFCTEILDHSLAGDEDHCVARVDRAVVGRQPIPVRRTGIVPNGDSVVVVGHPAVLPMKIAGGAIVQDNLPSDPHFQSNLDTYGGNSGSMVVNTSTWEIEGILVRGAPDYTNNGSCTESNRVPDDGNDGFGLEFEEVSKTTTFASVIPELVNSTGVVFIQRFLFNCDDSVSIELRDIDLAGNGTHDVTVTSSSGDSEQVTLTENGPSTGIFAGTVPLFDEAVVTDDGTLQAANADSVLVTYADADDGSGSPATVELSAFVDCVAPAISNVALDTVAGVSASVSFTTNEDAVGKVMVGTSCGVYTFQGTGGATTNHVVEVGGLAPLTDYWYAVEATDIAGNPITDDNGGNCYTFTTTDQPDYFTQSFTSGADLEGGIVTFEPDGSVSFYDACRDTTSAFPTDPSGGTVVPMSDDSSYAVSLTGGETVSLYGQTYSTVYICSNGYVGLGYTGDDYSETIGEHFGSGARICGFWDDLNPNVHGSVIFQQLADRIAITWDGVAEYSTTNFNSFQVEMYFDGTITITHLDIDALDGIVGLSGGTGTPGDFIESDLSAYGECTVIEPSCCVGTTGNVDMDPSDDVSINDLTVMVDHLFVSLAPLDCPEEANTDGEGGTTITIGDLTALVDHLFISLDPPAPCE